MKPSWKTLARLAAAATLAVSRSVLGVTLASCFALPAAAQAATATVTGTITGGTLAVSSEPVATVSVSDLTDGRGVTERTPIRVQNTRGDAAAWSLTVSSTPSLAATHELADPMLTGLTVAEAGGTNTLPSSSIVYPVAVGENSPTPVRFFDAAIGSGRGVFTITPSIDVISPPDARSTFTSTLTFAIISGP